jgi:hypothetical protein
MLWVLKNKKVLTIALTRLGSKTAVDDLPMAAFVARARSISRVHAVIRELAGSCWGLGNPTWPLAGITM